MRRIFLASIALASCQPDLPHTDTQSFVTAVFDPTSAQVPLPNDLVFFNDKNSVCPAPGNMVPNGSPPQCAQAELLALFGGAFPSDQEVAITIDFQQTNFDNGHPVLVAPDLDVTSFTPSTFFIFGMTDTDMGEVPFDPITDADYSKGTDRGTLTIHHQAHAPWAEGTYAVFVRGGAEGVKTKDGKPVYASQVFDLIEQGKDMTDPQNLGLLKAQAGSYEAALDLGKQLNLLIGLYKDTAFKISDTRFPHQELAVLTTFKAAPAFTNVTIDPGRGLVPLPIDLLRDPTTGKLTALAACTLAGSSLNPDGTCPSPAAAGFQALDGFSTTGAILGPTSDLIRAATITPTSLMLFDLTDPANPAQVDPTGLILEPCEFTSACGSATALSPVIAIQPAGATSGDATSVFRSRPLKDATDYAIVMTSDILDKAGKPLAPGTVASVVRFQNPLTVGGKSALLGIDDTTAASLEKMRTQLQPVFAKLAAGGIDQAHVAMAYTFHTQTIVSQGVQLAALPYVAPAPTALPGTVTALTPAAALTKYGVDQTRVPSSNIDEVLEVDITTFNALDPLTGAFIPDPTMAVPEQIHVMIATPKLTNANVPACPAALFPLKCSPMMIFRHGLGRGRADMLAVADTFTEAGMTVVAIDAAKHGDRAFCTKDATGLASGCNGGATCVSALPDGAQGDAHPPGDCGAAGFAKHPVSPTCTGACATSATDGLTFVSGNFLVSGNFFRTRDSLRQDFIDQSQLTRAIAFAPSTPPGTLTGHSVFDHMFGRGVIIDPFTIYYSGQSLGAIQGMGNVATNPRISKAGFNVGGGTIVDVFLNSPAFATQVNALLDGLGIQRGTAKFLQFLVVAKTVADPADPINFAGHLTANTLPNLLMDPTGHTPQAPKKVLTQVAYCDNTVPNPFNFIAAANVPTGPLPTGATFFAPNATGTFQLFVKLPFNPATFPTCSEGAVEHGFVTDWVTPAITLNAQQDIGNFVMHDTLPLRVQHD